MTPIEEAITNWFGPRCPDHEQGCPACDAWAEYDAINPSFGYALKEGLTEAVTMAKLMRENDAQASHIAELEAEVAEARERLRVAVKSADLADAAIDTAWNDAIEAAANMADGKYGGMADAQAIRTLRR